MLPALPADKEDPVEQLQAVHRRLSRAKGSGQREAGGIFVAATSRIPFPLTAWAVRALTRLPQKGVVPLATNVPGPRTEQEARAAWRTEGARVLAERKRSRRRGLAQHAATWGVIGAGLAALKLLAPLRRALVKEGLEPSGVAPRLGVVPGKAGTGFRTELQD